MPGRFRSLRKKGFSARVMPVRDRFSERDERTLTALTGLIMFASLLGTLLLMTP